MPDNWTSIGTLLTLIGIAVAILAIVVGYYAARRFGARRTTLVVDTKYIRLLPIALSDPETGEVKILKLTPPTQYSVQIRLRNIGPKDVPMEAFNGHPLVFHFGSAVTGNVTVNTPSVFLETDGREARLSPRRIPTGISWHWNVQCVDSRPHLRIFSPITDVQLKIKQHRDGVGNGGLLIPKFHFGGSQTWWRERISRL